MRSKTRIAKTLICIAIGIIVTSAAHAQWTVVNLHPAGATSSVAYCASGANQVGWAEVGGVGRASLWSGTAASWVDLSPAGATFSSALGASGANQVGRADVGGVQRASLWSGTAASWVDLSPAGATSSQAFGASGANQVGYAVLDNLGRASLWSGTAASWVDLNPAGSILSVAWGASGANQVGRARFGVLDHASLWSGSAASWVDLRPAGAGDSNAYGASGVNQVGYAVVGGVQRASLWSGTAASWVDLNPAGATESYAYGVSGANQVGWAEVGGVSRASLWSGTASSWVDLHALLPAGFLFSEARSIATDGVNYYIAGFGFNTATNRTQALLWVSPVEGLVLPDSYSFFRGSQTGGVLSDLLDSDDSYITVQPGITLSNEERQVQLIVDGTAPTETPSELRFRLEAHADINNIGQWIDLWNYDTDSYEEVDFMIATTTDSIVEVSITTDPGRFIQAGTKQMKARVSYKEAGIILSYPWLISFDQTVWIIVS